ncbi:MAG: hypothetical protein QNJ15_01945 [Erythrobacter sp.]|nr:hypothetical protein [Erythrobacter sp.]
MISTALALALSLPVTLQAANETAVAIKNDDPETWSVEYPRIIRPYVVKYRKCLNGANRRVTGEADFEMQHRTDIPRCAEIADETKAGALDAMQGARTRISADEVETLFRNIGRIHIARGRDLDDQFMQRMQAAARAQAAYEDTRPRGLVIEMQDASVVKARTDRTAPNQDQGARSDDAQN